MNAELAMGIARQAANATYASDESAIAAEIHDALEANRLDLPALPDMALKIKNLTDGPNVSAESLADLLSSYPAISMHIVGAANSAALSDGTQVNNLRGAVSRLGNRMLRALAMNFAMTGLFQARSPFIDRQLKELWKHSREVAANSYVLVQRQQHLDPGQAMLAGLVHDIGALPLYLYADRCHSRLDQTTLEELVRKFSAAVGSRLLQSWSFPYELIDVVAGHEDLQRMSNSPFADYADVVTVANLQMPGIAKFVAWRNVPAAEKLGYYAGDCRDFLSNHADRLAAVKGMLEAGATRH